MVQVPTINELKQLFAKVLFSRTDKVTKVSDGSVVNGFLFGQAKGFQKVLKDLSIAQSHYFPDYSYGEYLDSIAEQYGLPTRLGALGSSVYLRLHGAVGTTYNAFNHTARGVQGVEFLLQEDATIGSLGFTYALFASTTVGEATNVAPLSINSLTNAPTGHEYVVNEFQAIGGRDFETDDVFRNRIKNSANIVAKGTLAAIEQVLIKRNQNVLRVFNHGVNLNGKLELSVLSQNAVLFSPTELEELVEKSLDFFSMSDTNIDWLNNNGINMRNVEFQPIDISLRAQINTAYDVDAVRQLMQVRMNKYIDYRTWVGGRVEWDDLLQIAKTTEGVLYVPDATFVPNADVIIDYGKLPRIRGFELRDINGDIVSDGGSILNPTYFPNSLDFNFIKTALRTI